MAAIKRYETIRLDSRKGWVAAVILTGLANLCNARTHVIEDPQPVAAGSDTSTAIVGSIAERSEPMQIQDLDFPGGTLKQYVDAIAAAIHPVPMNVIYKGGAERQSVQAVRLRGVTPRSAMFLLERSLTASYLTIEFLGGAEREAQGIFIVSSNDAMADEAAERSLLTRVYSLRELTIADSSDQQPAADTRRMAALAAIEQGLTIAQKPSRGPTIAPLLRFHSESGLLFVKGNGEQQFVVESVVRELKSSFQAEEASRRGATIDRKKTVARDEKNTISLRVAVGQLKRERVIEITRSVMAKVESVDGQAAQIAAEADGIAIRGRADVASTAWAVAVAAAKALGEDNPDSLPKQ